ncbi:MAG: hypothetical protein ACRCYP_01395 [Alphaproteobacteria bacterium]
MLLGKKIAICLLMLMLANVSFAREDGINSRRLHHDNMDAVEEMLHADRLLLCPIVCSEKLCKFEEFQTFCEAKCDLNDEKINSKFKQCMKQKSIAIPPLSLVTGMMTGAEVGAEIGSFFPGGTVSGVTSNFMDVESSRIASGIASIPGAAVGVLPGALGGLLVGGGYAALETALISFCLGFCTKKMCSKPSIKEFCQTACSKGREPYIKHCLEASAAPSK